jgi:hypothetical protein
MTLTTIYIICGVVFIVTLIIAIFLGRLLFGKKEVTEEMQFQN